MCTFVVFLNIHSFIHSFIYYFFFISTWAVTMYTESARMQTELFVTRSAIMPIWGSQLYSPLTLYPHSWSPLTWAFTKVRWQRFKPVYVHLKIMIIKIK